MAAFKIWVLEPDYLDLILSSDNLFHLFVPEIPLFINRGLLRKRGFSNST